MFNNDLGSRKFKKMRGCYQKYPFIGFLFLKGLKDKELFHQVEKEVRLSCASPIPCMTDTNRKSLLTITRVNCTQSPRVGSSAIPMSENNLMGPFVHYS